MTGRPSGGDWAWSLGMGLLGATWPLADFVRRNEGQYLPTGRLTVYALIVVAVAAGAILLAGWVRPARLRPVAVVSVWLWAAFFHFNVLFDGSQGVVWEVAHNAQPLVALLMWSVLAAAGARMLWKLAQRPGFRLYVSIFLGVLWVINVAGAASMLAEGVEKPRPVAAGEATPFRSRPNVYHLILDQYPRADVARRVLDLDISPFESDLRSRGFWVGTRTYTAYPSTVTAIPAVLQADYTTVTAAEAARSDEELTAPLLGGAAMVREFKNQGYQYLYASAGPDGWGRCRGLLVDLCLSSDRSGLLRTEAEQVLLRRTPLSTVVDTSLRFVRPDDVLDALDERRSRVHSPFLLVAHLLNPHEPFEYGPGCAVRDRSKEGRTEEDYVNEIVCLNRELLRVVDRIRADDPDAVIIFQADHGTSFEVKWRDPLEKWSEDLLAQRFAVFDARLGPDGCPAPREPDVTVNTYPWLLACLRGEEPRYREPRAFLWRYGGHIEEIPDPFEAFGDGAGDEDGGASAAQERAGG